MSVNPVSLQAMAIQKHQDLVKSESRHLEMVVDQRHIKERLVDNEIHRIEANRRMMRAGQNIDKLA
jgi:hypothetical protein